MLVTLQVKTSYTLHVESSLDFSKLKQKTAESSLLNQKRDGQLSDNYFNKFINFLDKCEDTADAGGI